MSDKPWTDDTASRARVRAALALIDKNQATYPTCVVCDQHALTLDRFGCCTKTTELHREHRAELETSEGQ